MCPRSRRNLYSLVVLCNGPPVHAHEKDWELAKRSERIIHDFTGIEKGISHCCEKGTEPHPSGLDPSPLLIKTFTALGEGKQTLSLCRAQEKTHYCSRKDRRKKKSLFTQGIMVENSPGPRILYQIPLVVF